MFKKLLLIGMPLAAIVIISAQTASADYYDCYGNIQPGSPGNSECHYYTDTPNHPHGQTQTPGYVEMTPTCGGVPCDLSQTRYPDPEPDYQELIPDYDEVPPSLAEPDFGDDYFDNHNADTYIKNVRKYCVRDWCYILYELCYEYNDYCVDKGERVPRDEYEGRYDREPDYYRNWRDRLNNYTYNYFYNNYYYNNYYDDCGYNNRYCVYRGINYGRYHNRYWDF